MNCCERGAIVLRKSLCAAAVAAMSSAACAQTTVDINFPLFVQPLAGPVVADVVARQIDQSGDEFSIKQGDTDVTSTVVQSSWVVRAVDQNGDGVYETFVHRYSLDLSSLSYDDTMLVLKAQVWNGGVERLIVRTMSMTPPATIGTSDTTWVRAVNGDVVSFYLRIQGMTVLDRQTTVLMNDLDVTAAANLTETVVWDDSREEFIRDRMYRIDVDLASIGFGAVGDRVQLLCPLWGLYQYFVVHSEHVVEADPPVKLSIDECVADCVAAFISAVNATEATTEDGSETSIGRPDDVAAAADALDACLKNCGMSSGKRSVTVGSMTVIVGFGTVSGAADLVIAVGSNGSEGASGDNATAENTQSGGAAVAAAGNGAPGSESKGGEAKATSNGGDAVAIGGDGGDSSGKGGQGGPASAENKVAGKKATAQGGEGGTPGGGSSEGGSGGSAKGTAGFLSGQAPGGGGALGKHGTGAKVNVANGEVHGTSGTSV
ncbi:MAG: hypothetical protein HY812_08125 [Planctomycetes bacterium]|nr:hypothetical protein [Planctomycetota bacterium]